MYPAVICSFLGVVIVFIIGTEQIAPSPGRERVGVFRF